LRTRLTAERKLPMLDRIDHLVYAAVDLEAGVRHLEALTGVTAQFGGAHPGRGTQNALLSLGERAYLEILAPDPGQPNAPTSASVGLSESRPFRMVMWAIGEADLEGVVARSVTGGFPASVVPGQRRRPDGDLMSWRMGVLTDPQLGGGVTPFFIDWASTVSPARTAPVAGSLVGLRVQHPRPQEVRPLYDVLGIDQVIEQGDEPAVIATIETALGRFELR